MECKIFDSELKILEILWEGGEVSAKDVALRAAELVGWSKTTTYTVLKKCVEKGLVERTDPGFRCRALVSREEVRQRETRGLIDRMYGGRADRLVASLLEGRALDKAEIARLRQLVEVHSQAIKSMAVWDDELFRLFIDYLPFETSEGRLTGRTLKKAGEAVCVESVPRFQQLKPVFLAQGRLLICTGYVYDEELVTKMAR